MRREANDDGREKDTRSMFRCVGIGEAVKGRFFGVMGKAKTNAGLLVLFLVLLLVTHSSKTEHNNTIAHRYH